MNPIGSRYTIISDLQISLNGKLFSAVDCSLQRNVLLYRIGSTHSSDTGIAILGKAAELTHERFLHILDVREEGTDLFAVLKCFPGELLLPVLAQHRLTLVEVLTQVFKLGQALMEAMDAGVRGFSVTAENLWLTGSRQLMVLNGWSDAESRQCGARGLCSLLYQLCVRSETVPDDFEIYESRLRLALHEWKPEQTEAVVAMTRSVILEGQSLQALLVGMQEALGKLERQKTTLPATPVALLPESAADMSAERRASGRSSQGGAIAEPETKARALKGSTGSKKTLLIIGAFIAVFIAGALLAKITQQPIESLPASEQPAELQTPAVDCQPR